MKSKKKFQINGWRLELLEELEKQQAFRYDVELANNYEKSNYINLIDTAVNAYFVAEKLELYCTQLAYSKFLNVEMKDFALIEEVLKIAPAYFDKHPIILLFYKLINIFRLNEQPSVEEDKVIELLNEYEELLNQELDHLNHEDVANICTKLMNFVAKRLNLNNFTYRSKYVHYAIIIIRKNYDVKRNPYPILGLSLFHNLVKTILHLHIHAKNGTEADKLLIQDLALQHIPNIDAIQTLPDWIDIFIHQYQRFLPKNNMISKKRVLHFAKAYSQWVQGELIHAFRLISKDDRLFKETFMALELRILQLQILFDLECTDPRFLKKNDVSVDKKLESYRQKIQRNSTKSKRNDLLSSMKIMAYHLDYFEFFLKVLQKLLWLERAKYHQFSVKPVAEINAKRMELEAFIEGRNYVFIPWCLEHLKRMS